MLVGDDELWVINVVGGDTFVIAVETEVVVADGIFGVWGFCIVNCYANVGVVCYGYVIYVLKNYIVVLFVVKLIEWDVCVGVGVG